MLKFIPSSERSSSVVALGDDALPSHRFSGIVRNADKDEFQISLNLQMSMARVGLLFCISSIFDPLGFIAPWVIPRKRLLQALNKDGRGWDQPVTKSEEHQWRTWRQSMEHLGTIELPRCVLPRDSNAGTRRASSFFDTSKTAYGAVACLFSSQVMSETLFFTAWES
ncbi:hypothetical protein FGIG_07317 [Fasciola gigantica]|uniref:Uncharacterized protein n=1 Tax=Fasciola gigantica TaxID=46835 RepID=A0A504YYQ2_FASGI|nr:hypothetical protein FGIG_07317 [Fasciola gigantica]